MALAIATSTALADEPATESPLAAARVLLNQGKYAEAQEAFEALAAQQPAPAAVGVARSLEATGAREKAVTTLTEAAAKHSDAAELPAELGRLALERGDYPAAEQFAATALKSDGDQLLARWVQAEVFCATGKLKEADDGFRWFVEYYNGREVKDPEALRWIGLSAGQYARWNRLSDQFKFLVNEFYPDLLEIDPTCWRAHYEAGQLFAEKYNQPEAAKEFQEALTLNANAADVHAAAGRLALEEFDLSAAQAAAERALEINPRLLAAFHLKADVQLANFEPRQAAGILGDALKLDPTNEATLGRLAATYAAIDGPSNDGADTRFGRLLAEVNARNPHAGRFYEALGASLDHVRRWPAAAKYFQESATRMPQLTGPSGQLGMVLMRLGEEARAKEVLDEAAKIDPFNVRVNNSIKVLEVLNGYETLETEHFRIKFDPEKDRLLARYMGEWLEEVYPQLVRQMGFAPPEKSLFEIFSRSRNTDGHGWFSARMVGLPHIHPIGACAGKVVALQSPSEGQQRFNWARVVKHEFVHIINLQQTDFNIPHWFTEALAVINEGYARPAAWNELLARNSASGKLFNLETINSGFIRPQSSDRWTLAYCQAELYARYMLERFGDDAVAKMLAAYGDNLTTTEALRRALGVEQNDFERGYQEYVKKIVAALPPSTVTTEMNLAELQKALAKEPKNAELLAKMAQAQLARKSYPEARRWADAALAIDPRNGLANYVRARLHLVVGESKEALARLEGSLDREHPQENLLGLLAGLKLKSDDFAGAVELYELGAKHDPTGTKWLKTLAVAYMKSGDDANLTEVLTKLAAGDADELPIRKKLAQLALAHGDFSAAARWTLEALRISVMDSDLHAWRGEALAELKTPGKAAEEYAAAIELEPEDAKLRFALAECYVDAQEPAKAKSALVELLKREPDHPGARDLLEKIK